MLNTETDRRKAMLWNCLSILAAIAIVLFIAAFLPSHGQPTTIYIGNKSFTMLDVRRACTGSRPGSVVQLDPSVTVNCGRS